MTAPQIPLNSVPNHPTLSDLLNLVKKEIMLDLNCCHVGTIQSFNAATMTVVASINYTKTFFQLNATSGLYQPVQVNYAPVVDCPIVCLGGGKTNITFPIAQGDECLLIFNDRSIDSWFASGQFGPVPAGRFHAFSDAFALVGVKSTPNVLKVYDTVRALISDQNVSVGINPTNHKATIKNTASGTLGAILADIMTNLNNLCTQAEAIGNAVAIPGVPVNVAAATAITTIATNLTTDATKLSGLLE